MPIPLITLWQPYASLIFTGDKAHETRGFRYPAKYHGKRIAIHAALRPLRDCGVSPALDALVREVFGVAYAAELPRGAVLGTVRLEACEPTEQRRALISEEDYVAGDWRDGRFCWVLADPVALAEPLPMKGKQGWAAVDL